VDFYATWCGPCKILSPRLDELAGPLTNRVKFVKINVDEAPGSVPALCHSSHPHAHLLQEWQRGGQADRIAFERHIENAPGFPGGARHFRQKSWLKGRNRLKSARCWCDRQCNRYEQHIHPTRRTVGHRPEWASVRGGYLRRGLPRQRKEPSDHGRRRGFFRGCRWLWPRGTVALGRNLSLFPNRPRTTQLVQGGIYGLMAPSALHRRLLRFGWLDAGLAELAGPAGNPGPRAVLRRESPSGGALAETTVSGLCRTMSGGCGGSFHGSIKNHVRLA